MTHGQVSFIIGAVVVLLFCGLLIIDNHYNPETAKTPEQIKAQAYSDCVHYQTVNWKDISMCEQIKH